MSAQILELRKILERRFPDALPVTHRTAPAVATGVAPLDRILPAGGLPRGRVAVWVSGGGATAVLQAACGAVAARGERAAWVDGARVVTGWGWLSAVAGEEGRPCPVLVRPGGAREALVCAEELLRSGGFALVVLAGVEVTDAELVRLSRAAREGGGAFVVRLGGGRAGVAGLRLVSRIVPESCRWRPDPFGGVAEVEAVRVRVRAVAMGWDARTEFSLPVVHHDVRLSLEPGLVDRRGVRG